MRSRSAIGLLLVVVTGLVVLGAYLSTSIQRNETVENAPNIPRSVATTPVVAPSPPPREPLRTPGVFVRPGLTTPATPPPKLESFEYPGGELELQNLGAELSEEVLEACLVDHIADGQPFKAYIEFELDDRGLSQVTITPAVERGGVVEPDAEGALSGAVSACIDDVLWTLDVPSVPGVLTHGFVFLF